MGTIPWLLFLFVISSFLLFTHYQFLYPHSDQLSHSSDHSRSHLFRDRSEALTLARAESRLGTKNISISSKTLKDDNLIITSLTQLIKLKDEEIARLNAALDSTLLSKERLSNELSTAVSKHLVADERTSSTSLNIFSAVNCNNSKRLQRPLDVIPTRLQESCEQRFGVRLIDDWRSHEELWCSNSDNNQLKSELRCFPYHQEHKKLDGKGPDVFCEATNFFMDFSKIHGEASNLKQHLGQQYLQFTQGSIFSPCTRTSNYRHDLFMPHHSLQMSSFESGSAVPPNGSFHVEENPVYLLARDEDCENTFHHSADLMNIFLVLSILKFSSDSSTSGSINKETINKSLLNDLKILLFDRHPDGPYRDFLQRVYTPKHTIGRPGDYKTKVVLFHRLVFHLESPAALIFPKVVCNAC